MQEKPDEIILRCACGDPTHPLWVYASAEFNVDQLLCFYLDFAPAKLHTFFKRVKLAVAFIFHRMRPFVLYDMFLSVEEMQRFVNWASERLAKAPKQEG